ncbi:hypothetical protein MLD52_13375 [Puniceicoccaceae bacterium K14]|nr:hypothetical protein [Puniceicoccaceae bacterium K14]
MKSTLATIVLLAAVFLSGCQTTIQSSSIQANGRPPAMVYAVDRLSSPSSAHSMSLNSGIAENAPATTLAYPKQAFRETAPDESTVKAHQLYSELVFDYAFSPSQIELSDSRYNLPDHRWLHNEFLPYISGYFDELGISLIGEGMDCDNIAHLFRQQLALSNFQGGRANLGDIACGIVKTQQKYDFGGVEGDQNYHCLILLRTNLGWFAIEPQTGESVEIELYPNTASINWVLL